MQTFIPAWLKQDYWLYRSISFNTQLNIYGASEGNSYENSFARLWGHILQRYRKVPNSPHNKRE